MSFHPLHRCWVEIDLGALERNLKNIRAALPRRIRYIAVVKADAYGHGMAPMVARLMRSGADMFAVANVREAAEIREIGSGWPILLLSACLPGEEQYILDTPVIPTLSSIEEAERFSATAAEAGRPFAVHMKIDTGMGRLGVWHEEAGALYRRILELPGLQLQGLYTHFSSADMDGDFTESQRALFLGLLRSFETNGMLIHCDNSAGIETFPPDGPLNAVRIGLLQFGVLPHRRSLLADVDVESVLSFHTRVGLVKTLPAGTGVSYGRTHILERPTRIAVLTAGYGDGIPTTVSGKASVLIRGRRCPTLGRVTMDQTIVDVSGLDNVEPGEQATIIGSQNGETIPVKEFCAWSNHIPWEIFCSITKRVQRIYRADSGL